MSLKAFHIVFIAVSVLVAAGYGVWEVLRYLDGGSFVSLGAAVVAFVVAGGLVVYGKRFLEKLKHVGYL